VQNQVLPDDIFQILGIVVAISMFFTPVLFIFFEKIVAPRFEKRQVQRDADVIDEKGSVLIAGMGRFGQIVNRLLVANGIHTVVLDHDAKLVENLRNLNIKGYFGDATRPQLLETAGIDEVDLFVIAIDDRERAVGLVEHLKRRHPHVALMVRAFDQNHYYQLKQAGAEFIVKETYHSALDLACEALIHLGFNTRRAEQLKNTFIRTEDETSDDMFDSWVSSADSGIGPGYRELFMQQEVAIREAMQPDHSDRDTIPEDSSTTGKDKS
jgi:voltage-gated potassium channel Kch